MNLSKVYLALIVSSAVLLALAGCNKSSKPERESFGGYDSARNASPVTTAGNPTGNKIQDTINFIAFVLDKRNQFLNRANQDVYVRLDVLLNGVYQAINLFFAIDAASGKYALKGSSPDPSTWLQQDGCIAGTVAGVRGEAVTFPTGTTSPVQQFGALNLVAQCANALNYSFFSLTLASLTGTPANPGVPVAVTCLGYLYLGVPYGYCVPTGSGSGANGDD